MTTQYWLTGAAGDWSTVADWSSGVPTAATNAVVNNSSAVTVNGTAVANSLALNTSTLTVSGTLTLGTSLTVDGNSTLELSGGMLSAQSIISDSGTIGEIFGYGTVSGAVSGQVFITANGGTLKVEGSLAGDQAQLQINPGATLELSNSNTTEPVYFGSTGSLATLKLDVPAAFTGPIYRIVVGDTIDLAGIAANSAAYNSSTQTLTINETNGQQLIYNNVSGSVAGDIVTVASDNSGGTLVYWTAAPTATTWNTGTAGDWSTVADWSSGVPTAATNAVINNSSAVTVNGTAVANSLALNTSTLTVSGTLTLGTSLTVDGNSTLELSGGMLSAQSIISDSGTIGEIFGYGTVSGAVSGQVFITANGGTLKVEGSLAGDQAQLQINPGATLELSNSNTTEPVYFGSTGSLATLKLDVPAAFTGPIYRIVVGDTIDLAGIAANSAAYNSSTQTLTINETNGQQLIYNNVSGSVAGDIVTVASDNSGGTLVYWTAAPTATTWNTGTAGDWSTVADWSSGVPTAATNAVVNNSSAVTVNGTAVANSLALNTSTLTVSGTLTLGTSLTVDGNSTLELSGGMLSAQSIISDSGTIGEIFGYGTVSGAVSGQVFITANGGTLKVEGSLAGDQAQLQINPGATLELSNSNTTEPVYFGSTGSLATLKLDVPAAFTGPIYRIVVGDTIDLAGIAANSAAYNSSTQTLTINETNGQQLIYNNVSGSVAGDIVTVASDNSGGTLVYWGSAPANATWLTNPASADWATGSNWSTGSVPTETASFGSSSVTSLNVVSAITTIGTLQFNSGAAAYTFTLSNGFAIEGNGIVNNSGNAPTFFNIGGPMKFFNESTAGNAVITSSGLLIFNNASSSATANINNNYVTQFLDSSTAGNAYIINNSIIDFYDASTAADAHITSNDIIEFAGTSTAGNATITNNSPIYEGGALQFLQHSTAGQARLVDNLGGIIDFSGTMGPNNDGRVTAGSIEGAGNYYLGASQLTVGSNNTSTLVSGVISDVGQGVSGLTSVTDNTGGSIVKIGTGSLILAGNNTYTGGTTISDGIIQLGSGGASGSIIGNVIDNGIFALDRTDSYNLSGMISGSGAFQQLGTGTTILAGINSYSGGTTLYAGTLDLAAQGAGGTGRITFAAGTETLKIENAALSAHKFGNTIANFGASDIIDLPGLSFVTGATAAFNPGTHTLTVTSNGVTDTLTLTSPSGTVFKAISDGDAGTEIVLSHFAPPTVTDQTATQVWVQGEAVKFVLPADTFTDPQQEVLTYSATLWNGAALPAWLQFNPTTETFSGTVPSGSTNFTIEVTATDTSGLSASEFFGVTTPNIPTVDVSSFTIGPQQGIAASSFFTVSNPNGDNITQYAFEDIGGGSGHFTLNGTIEPDGQMFTVSASNLGSVEYVGGSLAGADTLVVDAYDVTIGTWSPSSSLTATTILPLAVTQIDEIYEVVLQRDPTNTEVTAWLTANPTFAGLVSAVVDSTEAHYNVYPVIQIIELAIGNVPTVAQLAGWVPYIEQNGLLQSQSQTNSLLDQMAAAFVASDNFGNLYNKGTNVDPNSPVTAEEMQVIIQGATGTAGTPEQLAAWVSTGLSIDQVFVDFALGDQYTTASQSTIQQFLTALVGQAGGVHGGGSLVGIA